MVHENVGAMRHTGAKLYTGRVTGGVVGLPLVHENVGGVRYICAKLIWDAQLAA